MASQPASSCLNLVSANFAPRVIHSQPGQHQPLCTTRRMRCEPASTRSRMRTDSRNVENVAIAATAAMWALGPGLWGPGSRWAFWRRSLHPGSTVWTPHWGPGSFDLQRNHYYKNAILFQGELDSSTPRVFRVFWIVVCEGRSLPRTFEN